MLDLFVEFCGYLIIGIFCVDLYSWFDVKFKDLIFSLRLGMVFFIIFVYFIFVYCVYLKFEIFFFNFLKN